MARLGKKNVFLVEVDHKFALIDQNSGMIHVVDATNAKAWEAGKEFTVLSSETAIASAGSVGSGGEEDWEEEEF